MKTVVAGILAMAVVGLLRAEVTWFEGGKDETGMMSWLNGQAATDGKLRLVPDTVFFRGRLRCVGQGDGQAVAWNGGKSFAAVEAWDAEDEMRWHLWFEKHGELLVRVSAQADEVELSLEGQTVVGKPGEVLKLTVGQTGRAMLSLKGKGTRFDHMDLTGAAVDGAKVLQARWRPAAVHAGRFVSAAMSEAGSKPVIWVMEMRPQLDDLTTYAPVTTPFGYFGSTFVPGVGPRGLNFSMWSYGRGKEEPPLERLSRLVAVGDRKAKFSGFGHEGTGVKPRGWDPFEATKADRQVLALRVEAHGDYHRYFGYFYDPEAKEWKFYAAGEKWSGGKVAPAMNPGAFVEVPGPPQVQRTGDGPREVHFRGWAAGEDGQWKRFDSMGGGHGETPQNKAWWVTEDGWFAMRAGGMAHYRYGSAKSRTVLEARFLEEELPSFLAAGKTSILKELPVKVGPVTWAGDVLSFELKAAGERAMATVFYGAERGASFPERWSGKSEPVSVKDGKVDLEVVAKARFARILVETNRGSYWSDGVER